MVDIMTYINPLSCVISAGNSSTDNLNSGNSYTFTGAWVQTNHPDMMVNVYADQVTTILIQLSMDGSTVHSTLTKKGVVNFNSFTTAVKGARYVRVVVSTASLTTTTCVIQTQFGQFRQGNLPFSASVSSDSDAMVTRGESESEIMKGRVKDQYIITKYGRNPDVDTASEEDIWNAGGDYTGFPTATAENFEVFSSNANDTSAGTGARTVRFWYLDDNHNMFDANGDFLTFDVTMNGTTGVDSGVSGMRIWRGKVLTSGSGRINAGNITCRWITTTSVIFASIPSGFGQTDLTNFTIPDGFTGYLRRYTASLFDTNSNRAVIAIKVIDFGSGTDRLTRPFVISTSATSPNNLYGGIEFLEKTDFVFRALEVDNNNADISVRYELELVKNT